MTYVCNRVWIWVSLVSHAGTEKLVTTRDDMNMISCSIVPLLRGIYNDRSIHRSCSVVFTTTGAFIEATRREAI